MSTPSPSPSPPPPHSPPTNPAPLSSKKTQPLPWTHQETTHLIQSYQEKWYSLKRGQLKASQWEEVAVTVAARCGYDYNHPSKSAVQCRHKMEKLRRRYRDEKRVVALGGTCYWQYFDLMDSLERGPLPISAQPLARVPCQENYHTRNISNGVLGEYDDDDKGGDEDDDDDDEEDYGYRSKLRSRSINYILRKPSIVNRPPIDSLVYDPETYLTSVVSPYFRSVDFEVLATTRMEVTTLASKAERDYHSNSSRDFVFTKFLKALPITMRTTNLI
ncbi:hypothetical protein DKX38_003541 [Salix brachista]|uniref:Myb-like domain-containing protein n=1 Tax=Salix brachista TaxID=2182728 RepID=A0A5N5NRW8_9ROSI|nr:hypothetical protein DKX38_003541 [Salix brachista]